MSKVYNCFTFLIEKILFLFTGLSPKAKHFYEGQKSIRPFEEEFFRWRTKNPEKKIIWFHCASLGEFEQGRPVIEAFKNTQPDDVGILLTFFSPSGYLVRKNYAVVDFVSYLPLDTVKGAKSFVEAVNPACVVFVKYEFWPNLVLALKKQKAIIIGISVILRENQIFFKPWGRYFKEILFSFDHLFVQNNTTAELLKKIDYKNYSIAGDTRFDRVSDLLKNIQEVEGIKEFVDGKKVFVVGSAWKEDMEMLIPFIQKQADLQFIIAPHEMHESEMNDWMRKIDAQKYSEYLKNSSRKSQVLIIDSIGLLSKLYQYATYAFVGGSFGKGLHNTLEAAVFGVPIFFGNKNYLKFQEAIDLIKIGVAFPISNLNTLNTTFESLDNDKLIAIHSKSLDYVKNQSGATSQIQDYLTKAL
jgi:3-deoxy-D-manno-octulosonic-acid transferase